MKSSTAADLVGVAMLSTLCFPFVGMAPLDRAARPLPTLDRPRVEGRRRSSDPPSEPDGETRRP